jgi:predicted RNase H-like nuclease (RuvC/YqgF family)
MNEIIKTLQGTISRLQEDNKHLEDRFFQETEKIHVLEKVLKEYKASRNETAVTVQHNDRVIRQLETYLKQMELVAACSQL